MHKLINVRNAAYDFSVKLSSCICSRTDRAVLAVDLCETCLVRDKAQ